MKPLETSFENLWAQAQPEQRPSAEALIEQARRWQHRERTELWLAFGLVSLTILFMLWLAWRFYPSENTWPPLALAVFLLFAQTRAWRYLQRLRRRPAQSLYQNLIEQRQAALRLQRFLYRVYLPGLTFGVVAGLWVSFGAEQWPWFLLGTGLTLSWVALTGWWGRRRQARKLARLDALLAQWEEENS